MLSGFLPFDGKNDREIFDCVSKGAYSMKGPEWRLVSKEAKDLIKGMLTKDPLRRLTAE